MLSQLVALLAPPACLACDGPSRVGAVLCAACRATLPWIAAPRCPRCGLPAPCRPCPARAAAFDAAWSAVAYEGAARALVHALKFRNALAAAEAMAAQIAANAPRSLLTGTLTPVPGDLRRRRRRGFDHAAMLAASLAARTGLQLARGSLRAPPLSRQLGADRVQRQRRREAVVTVAGDVDEAVVLVDDVHTTGATLDACARALRGAGARRVVALTYARTLR